MHPSRPNLHHAASSSNVSLTKRCAKPSSAFIDTPTQKPTRPVNFAGYLHTMRDELRQIQAGTLAADCQSLYVPSQGVCTGVVLLIHGFAVGTWQYQVLTGCLSASGLDVCVPRLPGHGVKDAARKLPGLDAPSVYHQFVQDVFTQIADLAQSRGVPVHVVGCSLGGAMALDLARTFGQQIASMTLIAPLVRPASTRDRILISLSRLVPTCLLDRLPFAWSSLGPTSHFYNRSFSASCVVGVARYAKKFSAPTLPFPPVATQLITSHADATCDPHVAERWVAQSSAPHHSFVFADALQVPHAMMEWPESAKRIAQITGDFVLRGRGTAQ